MNRQLVINTMKDSKRPKVEPNLVTAKFNTKKDKNFPLMILHPEAQ